MKITCGIYLYNTLTQSFLICHATKSKGGWSIPKGMKEEKEQFFEAASREMMEETNVDLNKINILEKYSLPPVNYIKQKKVLYAFLILTDTNFKDIVLTCNNMVARGYPEIDKIQWVTMEVMKNVVHRSQVENIPLVESLIKKYEEGKTVPAPTSSVL